MLFFLIVAACYGLDLLEPLLVNGHGLRDGIPWTSQHRII